MLPHVEAEENHEKLEGAGINVAIEIPLITSRDPEDGIHQGHMP